MTELEIPKPKRAHVAGSIREAVQTFVQDTKVTGGLSSTERLSAV